MSIFLSLKLTERLGIWFEIEPFRQWKRQVYNYATFGEGRCRYVILGPISIGCNYPDSLVKKVSTNDPRRVCSARLWLDLMSLVTLSGDLQKYTVEHKYFHIFSILPIQGGNAGNETFLFNSGG